MTLSYIPADTNDEGILKAAASGVLPSGQPVIVNADGTVSVVAASSQAIGSAVVFKSGETAYYAATFDSLNNRVVVAYYDGTTSPAGFGTAVVGTVSGTAISFGTPVVFEGSRVEDYSITFDSNSNKVVIAYKDVANSSYGTAIVGTVSGTTISFGTAVVFESAASTQNSCTFDSNSNKVVIAYKDDGNSSYGTAIVGTVSGTGISFGSAVVYESANSVYGSITFDSNSNKVVISYSDAGNSYHGTSIVGTVSGTSISFGSAVVFEAATVYSKGSTFDSNSNKVVIAYKDAANSNYGTAIVGTVSGTAISFGSAVVFNAASSDYFAPIFDSNANKVVIAYQDAGNSGYGTLVVGTVSGTAISFGSEVVYETASSPFTSSTFDSNSNKVVIAYRDDGNSYSGTGIVFQTASTTLTAENYIGISTGGTYADGSNATVNIIGNTADVPERNYALDSASYDNKSADVNSLASVLAPRGLAFNTDGSRMFTTESSGDAAAKACYQFDLSTNFDVSTASYNNVSLNVSNASANRDPMGVAFNTDGTRLFVVGSQSSADGVFQYNLSTGFNLSTGSDSNLSVDTSSQDSSPRDLAFNSDGTKMFVLGSGNDKVSQYTLSSAFTINTASFDSVDLDVSSQEANPTGLAFNSDGTQLFVGGFGDNVHMYNLSSAFNLSTASYSGVTFDVSSQAATPLTLEFNATGTKMYVAKSPGEVLQYSTSFSLTAGQSCFVQTDGTIGLTAANPSVFAGTAISATKLIVKT